MANSDPNRVVETVESIANHLRTESLESRRAFLRKSAGAGAGALAMSVVGSNVALADDVNVDDGTDLEVLQFALTLEHLENAFYRDVGGQFDEKDFHRSEYLRGFGGRIRNSVADNFQDIAAHEQTHVSAITDTVEAFGGTPVSEATYDFGYTTPSEFFGVAKALENTGVAAYAGAAPTVDNDDVFNAAIGIHSVEARHAGFLNEVNGTSPFPDAVDQPKTMDEVISIAGQFIVGD